MLYVDQPIGTGFSYGTDPVTSTVTAAPYVWNLLQAFFAQFPQYENRDFGIFTESYGGHYGPGKLSLTVMGAFTNKRRIRILL
jgi:carboxypeptidase C (cathepsin A)